ncbi:hypothetical protein ACJIZ3_003901 [Penstemon smallii]|uniref:Uncharacterized protein n=1 Tax=Penstemon smallii TaxID=265156 RepID=A0ABD3S0L2_9LAMI
MAAAPVKSQPLHNFSLPPFKWAHTKPPTSSCTEKEKEVITKATSYSKKETTNKSQRLSRGFAEGGQVERKEKRKVWISLSREEIEEDVYALTGGKPARKPKKWPKNVQKTLDNLFPGMYLVGVAADSYRVHDGQEYGANYLIVSYAGGRLDAGIEVRNNVFWFLG